MNSHSQETLRRVTQNDPSLTTLILINDNTDREGEFHTDNSDDYSALGTAIANNTHLEKLIVTLSDGLPLGVSNRGFYDGLKSNSSISNLRLWCNNRNIARGVGQEILKAYQENNSHLTVLHISNANLQSGVDRVILDTLRNCRNLKSFDLFGCNITYEQLLPIVDAVRGHRLLEELQLYGNNIGNAGCDALATLLTDPNCNLRHLDLGSNAINNEGATTIANSLTNNTKLQQLYLFSNPIDQTIHDVFSNILCNASSIEQTYSSNHTLQSLAFGHNHGRHLASLLKLNKDTNNKSHVAIKKILKYHPNIAWQHLESLIERNTHTNKSHVAIRKILKHHPNIDMGPFFEWDAEEEQTLKALPYVIDWFERARVAIADDDEQYGIKERKLCATFQFAKAMPLLLEGISRIKVDKKEKRSEYKGSKFGDVEPK